jgi:hypothetical protein
VIVAFQSCRARTKAFPIHNAIRGEAKANSASHSDTSNLFFRREVGDGTAMLGNNSYEKQILISERNGFGAVISFLQPLIPAVRSSFRPAAGFSSIYR